MTKTKIKIGETVAYGHSIAITDEGRKATVTNLHTGEVTDIAGAYDAQTRYRAHDHARHNRVLIGHKSKIAGAQTWDACLKGHDGEVLAHTTQPLPDEAAADSWIASETNAYRKNDKTAVKDERRRRVELAAIMDMHVQAIARLRAQRAGWKVEIDGYQDDIDNLKKQSEEALELIDQHHEAMEIGVAEIQGKQRELFSLNGTPLVLLDGVSKKQVEKKPEKKQVKGGAGDIDIDKGLLLRCVRGSATQKDAAATLGVSIKRMKQVAAEHKVDISMEIARTSRDAEEQLAPLTAKTVLLIKKPPGVDKKAVGKTYTVVGVASEMKRYEPRCFVVIDGSQVGLLASEFTPVEIKAVEDAPKDEKPKTAKKKAASKKTSKPASK